MSGSTSVGYSTLFSIVCYYKPAACKSTEVVVNAIESLTEASTETESSTKQLIKFLKDIFQEDSLSLMFFVPCLNPLSFVLKKCKSYSFRKLIKLQHTHNFFIHDIKLY